MRIGMNIVFILSLIAGSDISIINKCGRVKLVFNGAMCKSVVPALTTEAIE